MARSQRRWTVDEVQLLNERCALQLEVIDGTLLRPEGAPQGWEAGLEGWLAELLADESAKSTS